MEGAIDENGNEIIPCKYEYLDDFVNGLARSKLDGHINYLDNYGNIELQGGTSPWNLLGKCLGEQYIPVGIRENKNLYSFETNHAWGIATRESFKNSETIIPVEYEIDEGGGHLANGVEWTGQAFLIETYHNPTGEDGKFERQVISTTGETIIPVGYDYITSIGEGTSYICETNTKTKKEMVIYSATGQKKGEYEGDEVSYGRYDGFTRISIKENEDLSNIIVLDIYGDIIKRWENVKGHEFENSGLYRIDVDNMIEIGNVMSKSAPLIFSETDIQLFTDGILISKWDKKTNTYTQELLYPKGNNWKTLLTTRLIAGKGQRIRAEGQSIRTFTVSDNSRWLPFSTGKTYHIGVID